MSSNGNQPEHHDSNSEAEGRSVLSLIRDIQSGAQSAKLLMREDRRRCVEELTRGGYSASEIADILDVTERTVARDRKVIREANALETGPGFARQMAGSLVQEAETVISRLRRLARAADTPAPVKADCERGCWEVSRQLVEILQKLGYLPTAATEIRGEITHRTDTPAPEVIEADLHQLAAIAHRSGDENAIAEVQRLQERSERLLLADGVEQVKTRVHQENDTIHDQEKGDNDGQEYLPSNCP